MKSLICLIALVPSLAFAGPPHNTPNDPDVSSSSNATGVGVGIGVGAAESNSAAISGSHSGASSGSLSSAHQGQSLDNTNVMGQHTGVSTDVRNTLGNDSRNTNANENAASASNDGNALSTSYENDTTALALGLGSTTAAPVDTSACRKGQTAGWRVAVIERTGRNKYDENCLAKVLDEDLRAADFARCMDLARAYLAVRLEQAYALQLAACGGALEKALIPSALSDRYDEQPIEQASSNYATKEELDRAFNAAQSK